ncbi:MAG TPA: AmmeMemoRadiSam system protein B [Nitrospiria bacterium]|nr:AmmeMemoRadiSam system protein B [Nitrospiria bacterium]
MVRSPAVAGQFYPAAPEQLRNHVMQCLEKDAIRESARAVVCPHAGLVYSGPVAGAVYSRVQLPDTVLLVGPNHTGFGPPLSIYAEGRWNMPNGAVSIDHRLAADVLTRCHQAESDTEAHRFEHCLEVQLPFLQYLHPTVAIVPVLMMSTELAVCRDLGEAMATAVTEAHRPVLIIASTDMSHYEPDAVARRKDHWANNEILSLNPIGLHRVVREKQISMCGFAPTVAMLFAVLRLGAKQAKLVKYMTSGEASGDYNRVVGYSGFLIN